tara:strand:- start:14946 stop:17741 length:2796 start_codon:yes stop_codon:yes gene_type:complete
MSFRKRLLCSEISLLLSAGLVLTTVPESASAQLPLYTCRPNTTGDGWICDSTGPAEPGNTADGTDRYNSDNAVLPQAPQADVQQPPLAPVFPVEDEATAVGIDAVTPQVPAPLQQESTALQQGITQPVIDVRGIVVPVSDHELDWIPRESLTAEQLQGVTSNCCGAFIDPNVGVSDYSADPATAETLFRANTGFEQISQNLITIDGDVVVQQGYRTVINDNTTSIDRDANTILMDGNVEFREPGLLLLGTSAFIDSDANANRITSAQYVLHDYGAHGQAESIVYNSDSGVVSIENGEFSRCEPGSNFWKLEADTIILDQTENRGYASNVKLRLGEVPIFYYPFTLPFPLGDESVSGFLAPSTGSTRSGGFDFELPYYFKLAPHYDATLSPRHISDRGTMVGLEARYLASWSMNTLNMSSLSGDNLFDPATANIPGSDSPIAEDRWFIGYEHSGRLGRNFTTFIDYNHVSDEDYFYDLGSNGLNLTSRTHLNRRGALNFYSEYLRAGINVQRIQVIDPFIAAASLSRPYDRLPQFHFESDTYLAAGFRVGIRGEITSFDRNLDEARLSTTQLSNGALVKGERINLEPEISWSIENPGWFVRSTAKYKHMEYKLDKQATGTPDDPDLGVGVYSVDGGLVFEREMTRGTGGWTQTLEPRVYYLYSEFEDQSQLPLFDTSELNFSFSQLFRDDRFSGGDRSADADQATVAITSRILNPAGKETARVSIGQIQYFEDRLVSLSNPLQTWLPRYSPLTNNSALAGEVAFTLGSNWRFNSDLQWNEDTQEIDEGSIQLRYQRDNDHLFNVAYRYRSLVNTPYFTLPGRVDPRIKQTDISGIWPVNANWKLLARWNYDHSNSRNLESFAGIEWSNCCATIRLIGREWVDEDELFLPNIEPNRGIFVQFTLNGLGNLTGGGLSNLLSDGIWGFRETEYGQ